MKKKRTWFWGSLAALAGVVFLILLWWLISAILQKQGNELLPYPYDTFLVLLSSLFGQGAGDTYIALGWTIARLLIGFSIAFIVGAILGSLGGLWKLAGKFMAPGVALCRTVPTAAVVILLVGIFYQYNLLSPYIPSFLVFLVAFPLVYEAFRQGINEESQDTKDALALDCGAHSLKALVHVYWPDSISYILLAIVQSLGLSLKVSVMSEILVNSSGANGGLGGLIQNARQFLDMKSVIAYSLVAVILIGILDIPLFFLKRSLKKHLEGK
jgi:ABC-type nitrate/sulfonate/bicarbonate transport system permease component